MAKKRKKSRKKAAQPRMVALSLMVFVGLLLSIIAFSSTLILAIGMLPTLVSFIVDKTKNKSRTISVAAMNIAACLPFLIELWAGANSVGVAAKIITNPLSIIIMYTGALAGYCIDWTLSGMTSSFLYKKAQMRRAEIKKKQKALIERWGTKVKGDVPLSREGHAIKKPIKDTDEN